MRFTDYSTRVGGYAVVIQDSAVLLSWLNGEKKPERAGWTLPGGGVDFDEQVEDAVVREVWEETGYEVELTGFLRSHSYTWDDEPDGRPAKFVRLFFTARVVGGTLGTVEVGGSTDRAAWIPLDQVASLKRLPAVDLALEAHAAAAARESQDQ